MKISDWKISIFREARMTFRQMGSWVNGLCFFLLIGWVYQLLIATGTTLSPQLSASLIWVLSLLSIMLVSDQWISRDIETGLIDAWLAQRRSLLTFMRVKLLVQWLVVSGLLVVLCPILALQLGLEAHLIPWLMLSIGIGGLGCICFCGLGAVITASQSQSGVLLSVLVLPFNIPSLVFGIGVVSMQAESFNPLPVLAILTAISVSAFTLLPFGMAYAAKIVNE